MSITSTRYFAFFSLFLAYASMGIMAVLLPSTLTLLAQHNHVELNAAGLAIASVSLGCTLGVLACGWVCQRFNAKFVVAGGTSAIALAGMMAVFSTTFLFLCLAEFVMGLGFAAINVGINVAVTRLFSRKVSASLTSIYSAYGIGALMAPLLVSMSLSTINSIVPAYTAGTLLALLATLFMTMQHIPAPTTQDMPTVVQQGLSPSYTGKRILLNAVLWLFVLQLFLYTGADGSFGDWLVTVVQKGSGVSLALAAPVATMYWLGQTTGRLAGARLLHKELLTERQLITIGLLGAGLSGLTIVLSASYLWICFASCLLTGFFLGPVQPSLMGIANRRFSHMIGTLSSMLFLGAGASGVIFPPMVGNIIAHTGITIGLIVPATICVTTLLPFFLSIRKTQVSKHVRQDFAMQESVGIQ